MHKVSLVCGFVNGYVLIGVSPALPINGVHVILGNDLAANRVWVDGSPPYKYTLLLTNPTDHINKFAVFINTVLVTRQCVWELRKRILHFVNLASSKA